MIEIDGKTYRIYVVKWRVSTKHGDLNWKFTTEEEANSFIEQTKKFCSSIRKTAVHEPIEDMREAAIVARIRDMRSL